MQPRCPCQTVAVTRASRLMTEFQYVPESLWRKRRWTFLTPLSPASVDAADGKPFLLLPRLPQPQSPLHEILSAQTRRHPVSFSDSQSLSSRRRETVRHYREAL